MCVCVPPPPLLLLIASTICARWKVVLMGDGAEERARDEACAELLAPELLICNAVRPSVTNTKREAKRSCSEGPRRSSDGLSVEPCTAAAALAVMHGGSHGMTPYSARSRRLSHTLEDGPIVIGAKARSSTKVHFRCSLQSHSPRRCLRRLSLSARRADLISLGFTQSSTVDCQS